MSRVCVPPDTPVFWCWEGCRAACVLQRRGPAKVPRVASTLRSSCPSLCSGWAHRLTLPPAELRYALLHPRGTHLHLRGSVHGDEHCRPGGAPGRGRGCSFPRSWAGGCRGLCAGCWARVHGGPRRSCQRLLCGCRGTSPSLVHSGGLIRLGIFRGLGLRLRLLLCRWLAMALAVGSAQAVDPLLTWGGQLIGPPVRKARPWDACSGSGLSHCRGQDLKPRPFHPRALTLPAPASPQLSSLKCSCHRTIPDLTA